MCPDFPWAFFFVSLNLALQFSLLISGLHKVRKQLDWASLFIIPKYNPNSALYKLPDLLL